MRSDCNEAKTGSGRYNAIMPRVIEECQWIRLMLISKVTGKYELQGYLPTCLRGTMWILVRLWGRV